MRNRLLTPLLALIAVVLIHACNQGESFVIRNASISHLHPPIIGYYSVHHDSTDSGYVIKYCLDSILREGKVEKRMDGTCDPHVISKNSSGNLEFAEVRERMPGRRDSLFYIAYSSKSFALQNTSYEVYRFVLSDPQIDGRQIRFWTPELGFLLWELPDWHDESSLIALDGHNADDISQLIQLIKRDTIFFRGDSGK